jgi:hypothetical protein
VARLGELLVSAGWITAEQCVQALNAQVLWGGRLGTNLIELGFVQLDEIARALGRQHACPAALSHHFAAADHHVQRELSVSLAERFQCLPLSRATNGRVVVATTTPLTDEASALIAEALEATDVRVAVAAELRIRYQLERVYRIARESRFVRVRGPAPPFVPHFEINEVELEPEIPLDAPPAVRRIARDAILPLRPATNGEHDDVPGQLQARVEQAAVGRAPTKPDRRRYLETIEQQPLDVARAPTLGRVPLKRLAVGTDGIKPASMGTNPPPISTTLDEATRAIRACIDRETAEGLVIQTIAQFLPSARAALLFVVRGETAIAHVGFSRVTETLPEVAVPLGEPGLVPDVIARNRTMCASASDLGIVDRLVLSALGLSDGDLVVAPIAIGVHVVGVIVMATDPDAATEATVSITAAAGVAFTRLMRSATQR